jgi:hypothetical protein
VRSVAAALVHHPVLGRGGEILTTTLTNFDLHDLARLVRVYGLAHLYITHPLESQRYLAQRIVDHWVRGPGGRRIPDRATALEVVKLVPTLDDACADLGADAELWTTSAITYEPITTFSDARALLHQDGPAVMLCFGTGWGLAPEIHARATLRLEPIRARRDTGYNHLSVRAATAITFDRLLG